MIAISKLIDLHFAFIDITYFIVITASYKLITEAYPTSIAITIAFITIVIGCITNSHCQGFINYFRIGIVDLRLKLLMPSLGDPSSSFS